MLSTDAVNVDGYVSDGSISRFSRSSWKYGVIISLLYSAVFVEKKTLFLSHFQHASDIITIIVIVIEKNSKNF